MLIDTDRDKNIDLFGRKYIFSVGHILLSDTEFKGEGPTPSSSRPPLRNCICYDLLPQQKKFGICYDLFPQQEKNGICYDLLPQQYLDKYMTITKSAVLFSLRYCRTFQLDYLCHAQEGMLLEKENKFMNALNSIQPTTLVVQK